MLLPRLFTCPTVTLAKFQLEFEMSVIVTFADVDGQPGIRCLPVVAFSTCVFFP